MSFNTIVLNTGQQAIINTDTSKVFLWGNRYQQALCTNDTYEDGALTAGTLMGKVSATGEIKPLVANASDGSQYPIGILAQDITLDAGEQKTLSYCVLGDVNKSKVIFMGSGDDFDTVVDGRTLYDRIGADTVGINLVESTEMTAFDNS
jgi:hypothetical protein